jgi:polyhydroxyalkanoate depolymerase
MMYAVYERYEDWASASRMFAATMAAGTDLLPAPVRRSLPVRMLRANAHLAIHTRVTHTRPDFGIDSVEVGGKQVDVEPVVLDSNPFCALLRFAKDVPVAQPRVLLVPAMSGHFPTLLRETIRTMSRDHDVYVIDWHNARDIPVSAGRFSLDDYIAHTRAAIEFLGDPVHVMAVCQPSVPTLAAVALLAQDDHEAQPRSMTLMAGPIDTRVNPTEVNDLATSQPIEWFERNLITTVPRRHLGAGRRVYPGFVQLSAFMSMNLERHVKAHFDLWGNVVDGDGDEIARKREFYDEYFAVADLDADYYLETVQRVFQEHHLARGMFEVDGRLVEPAAIRRTALLTVEGERDDICSVGQTVAAQDLCSSIPPSRRAHHLQPGVGHYGVFSGSRWDTQVYPRVKNFILAND